VYKEQVQYSAQDVDLRLLEIPCLRGVFRPGWASPPGCAGRPQGADPFHPSPPSPVPSHEGVYRVHAQAFRPLQPCRPSIVARVQPGHIEGHP